MEIRGPADQLGGGAATALTTGRGPIIGEGRCWAEGPFVLPALGNAQGAMAGGTRRRPNGPTVRPIERLARWADVFLHLNPIPWALPQGWENGRPFGATYQHSASGQLINTRLCSLYFLLCGN